jgi:hypothetical protein
MPPWILAEEVFAWSRGIGLLIRLQHAEVEDPPYNKHIRTVGWHDAESLKTAVKVAINDIDSFQRSVDYPRIRELARKNRGRM